MIYTHLVTLNVTPIGSHLRGHWERLVSFGVSSFIEWNGLHDGKLEYMHGLGRLWPLPINSRLQCPTSLAKL